MKAILTAATLVIAFASSAALPATQSDSGMDTKDTNMGKGAGKKSVSKTHKGAGTVKKVDSAAGKVTIAHGPIKTMNWPGMNMTFTVKDKVLLGTFSQDKKVEFEFVQQGSDYVITSAK